MSVPVVVDDRGEWSIEVGDYVRVRSTDLTKRFSLAEVVNVETHLGRPRNPVTTRFYAVRCGTLRVRLLPDGPECFMRSQDVTRVSLLEALLWEGPP